jgi:hypothetical protein
MRSESAFQSAYFQSPRSARKKHIPTLPPIGRLPVTSFPMEFSQPFQSPRGSRPARPIFVCYTGIGRNPSVPRPMLASMPSLPDRADPPRPVPTLPGSRIQLIPKGVPHRNHPGDASCQKSPPDASPNLAPPTQPNENKHLKTSLLLLPHTGNMRRTGRVRDRPPEESAAQIVPRPLVRRRTPAVLSAASHPPPKRVSMWHRHVGQSPLSTRLTARRSQK